MVKAHVLVLNKSYLPVDIISWEDAITLWFKKQAEIVESYEDIQLHSWKSAMQCPAVIRLLFFVKPNKDLKFYKPFTRKNVYERDNGRCQYCGHDVSLNKMTFDHVLPRSQNGQTSWANIVCSCLKCNIKKANKTPKEAHMTLINKPYAPKIANDYSSGVINRIKDATKSMSNKYWRQWIYWNVEMESD